VDEQTCKRVYEMCCAAAAEIEAGGQKKKRKLVSLFEANEVAKRIGAGIQYKLTGKWVDGVWVRDLDEDVKTDEVERWLGGSGGLVRKRRNNM